MIERAIKLKDRVDLFCHKEADQMHGSTSIKRAITAEEKEKLLKNDKLEQEDWESLNEVMAILKKFYDLTIRAEGTHINGTRGILSNYMITLNDLVAHVREARDDIDQRIQDEERRLEDDEQASPSLRYLKVCTVNCWTKLDEYFAKVNDTPATYAACVTDDEVEVL